MTSDLSRKISFFIVSASPFLYYFGMLYLTIPLALTAIALWNYERFIFKKENLALFVLILFYLITFLSGFWSNNLNEWRIHTQVKLSLLLFPAFYLFGKTKKDLFFLFIKFFFFASVAISLLQLTVFFYKLLFLKYIFYRTISSYFCLFMHPSYFSLFIDFALISGFFISKDKTLDKKIYAAGSILLVINIFLAMSKIAFLVTAIIIVYIVLNSRNRTSKRITFLLTIIAIISGVIFSPRFSELAKSTYNFEKILSNPNLTTSSTATRVLTWNASLEVFNSFSTIEKILGTGTGDAKNVLLQFYKTHNYKFPYEKKLNSHNQFLETLIETGILGFSILLFLFTFAIYFSLKYNNRFLFWFLIIMFLNFTVESMLNRQVGVLFFAFGISVLMKLNINE